MKKKLLLLLLLIPFCRDIFSQDILVLKTGDEIKVKVSEVLPDIVKYKKWDNQDGPQYSETKGNIFMIKYQNGSKDVFGNPKTNNPTNASPEDVSKNDAVQILESTINGNLRKRQIDQIIKITSFTKTNGVMNNVGQPIYTIYCDMTVQFIADGWLAGNMFEGYWRQMDVYPKEPNLAGSGMPYSSKKYPKGTTVILSCKADMLKMDNGYKATGFEIKGEKIVVTGTGNNSNTQNQSSSGSGTIHPVMAKMINGTWYGDIPQGKRSFSVLLTCNSEKNEFKIAYPSLGCSGEWYVQSSTDKSIDFSERILTGKSGCSDGGKIRITLSGTNQLLYEYFRTYSTKPISTGWLALNEQDVNNVIKTVRDTISKSKVPEIKASPAVVVNKTGTKEIQAAKIESASINTFIGNIKSLKQQGNNYLSLVIVTANSEKIPVWCSGDKTAIYKNNSKTFWTVLKEGMKIQVSGRWQETEGEKEIGAERIDVLDKEAATSKEFSQGTVADSKTKSPSDYNFEKHSDIKFYMDDLAKAMSTNDRNTISQMINFPFADTWGDNPYNKSSPLGCKTVNQFFEKYDKIFIPSLKKAIISKKYRGYQEPEEGDPTEDVINKGEYLTGGEFSNGRDYWLAIKKINGKFKIYEMKFSP